MEMSGSFAQNIIRMRIKIYVQIADENKETTIDQMDAGDKSKLLAAIVGSSNQSVQP